MDGVIALGGKHPSKFIQKLRELPAIGADSGFDFLWKYRFNVKFVLGDFDSIQLLPQNVGVPYRVFPKEKDESDAELAFIYAEKELGWKSWSVIGGSGERIDHFLALLSLAPRYPAWNEWWMENDHGILLSSQRGMVCSSQPGQRVSIIPLGIIVPKVISEGLRWPIDSLDWKSQVSLSNETTNQQFSIYCEVGHIIILRDLEVALEFGIRSID